MDFVEPPLRGLSASTSVGKRQSEEMELDGEEEEPEQNAQDGPNNLGEANIGLG